MIKLLRRHQKKVLAIITIISMIVFVANFGPNKTGSSSGYTAKETGSVNGISFTDIEKKTVLDEWKALGDLRYSERMYQLQPFLLGRGATAAIDQKPDTFFILLMEARSHGAPASPEDRLAVWNETVTGIMKNLYHYNPDPAYAGRDAQAIADALTVGAFIDRSKDMMKITSRFRSYRMAMADQDLSLNVVTFPASKYLPQVPEPKEMDLQNQFDALSSTLPGNFGIANNNPQPLGFGYEIPNRVALQYIGLKNADVRNAAIAAGPDPNKPPSDNVDLDWHVQAREVFFKNRDEFDQMPVSTTRPSTRPDALSAAIAAATRPTTEPTAVTLADPELDYQLHEPIILDQLYNAATRTMTQNVIRDITDKFNVAFAAIASGGPGAADLKSKAFLDRIAADMKTKYGITLVYADIAQPKSADDLQSLDPLKDAFWVRGQEPVAFADYAIDYAQPLITSRNSQYAVDALSAWQPSQPLITRDTDVYLFRLTDIDPAHPPASLADVRDKVIRDWKLSKAYDLATKDAKSLRADALKRSLTLAAADLNHPVITTLPFNIAQLSQDPDASLPPLTFDRAAVGELAGAGNSLLSDPSRSATGNRPIAVADIFSNATVCVIELNSAKPDWNPDDTGVTEADIIQQARGSLQNFISLNLCNYDDAVRRTQFSEITPATAPTQ